MKNETTYYIVHGPKDGIPIVLIHAFPLNHMMWAPQISVLSSRYRVITYDVRGHGESDGGNGQYTIELFVDDWIALMDHLKIEKSILCGLSMGGYIALRAMERYPERVRGLILADTRSEADSDESKIKRAEALKLIQEKGVLAFVEGFVKSALAPETLNAHAEVAHAVREMILKNNGRGIGGALLALASRTDTTASLKNIKIPTLILVGEKDTITPPAAALAMQDKIAGAELHIIPQAGHLSNLENPEDFNQSLLDFLNRK